MKRLLTVFCFLSLLASVSGLDWSAIPGLYETTGTERFKGHLYHFAGSMLVFPDGEIYGCTDSELVPERICQEGTLTRDGTLRSHATLSNGRVITIVVRVGKKSTVGFRTATGKTWVDGQLTTTSYTEGKVRGRNKFTGTTATWDAKGKKISTG